MDDVLKILLKRVDVEGLLLEDLLHGVLEPKLKELVARTDNTLDDAVLTLVMPVLEGALKDLIAKIPKE